MSGRVGGRTRVFARVVIDWILRVCDMYAHQDNAFVTMSGCLCLSFSGAMVIASHDLQFLKDTCNQVGAATPGLTGKEGCAVVHGRSLL